MAPPIQMNVNGARGIKTWFGFTMTILYFCNIFVAAYLTMMTYFDKQNPQVLRQTTESGTYPKVDLIKAGAIPVVFVTDQFMEPIKVTDISKYFTFRYYKRIRKMLGGAESFYIDMIPCNDLLANSQTQNTYYSTYFETNEFFRFYNQGYGVCATVDESLMTVEGGGMDIFQSEMVLEVLPCTLTSGCVAKTELQDVSLTIMNPVVSVNLSDHDTPLDLFQKHDSTYTVSSTVMQQFKNKFSLAKVIDEKVIMAGFEDKDQQSVLNSGRLNNAMRDDTQITCTDSMVSDLSCKPYLSFSLTTSGSSSLYYRTYKGLLKTLSEIGGIMSITYIFFYYLNLIYVRHAKRKILVGLVFDFIYSDEQILKSTVSGSTPEDQRKYLEKEAFDVIKSRLDTITIVREINNLKVLTHMFLKDYHRKMVPLVSLALHLQDKRPARKEKGLTSVFSALSVVSKKYVSPQQRKPKVSPQFNRPNQNSEETSFNNSAFARVKKSIQELARARVKELSSGNIQNSNHQRLDLEERVDAYFHSKIGTLLVYFRFLRSSCARRISRSQSLLRIHVLWLAAEAFRRMA